VLDLQTIAHNAGHSVPLLIAIDQENGGVNSLYDEIYIRQFPSAMGMAATGSKKLAKDIARATADELTSCGINWILGPVLNVSTNARNQPLGVRSISDDPQEVSDYGVEYMKGYQEGGLATCGKHFPSYDNLDFFAPATDVPTITDSRENLSQTALVPFRNAISYGIDAMMVGGVAMASSNTNVMHTCLSEQIVRDLLRYQMLFEGVVVLECLETEALSRNIGISGGTVMAFKVGCDVILTCRSLSVQEEAINGLKAGLGKGMIERSRVQESMRRVLALKGQYTSWEKAFAPLGLDNLTRLQPLHTTLSAAAYSQSITVVRDEKRYLPLSKTITSEYELLVLTPLVKPLLASSAFKEPLNTSGGFNAECHLNGDTRASIMSGEKVFREFGRSLARHRKGKTSHTSYTANGVRPIHETLLERAQAVIVVTADAGRNMYQNAFAKHINMLCKLAVGPDGLPQEKPCVFVAVSSPSDFAADASIGTYLCTYDFTETALQALVRVLYGDLATNGTLPGSFSHNSSRPAQTRQQWLVESFNEDRDLRTLDTLLKAARTDISMHSAILSKATGNTFLLRNPSIEEAHFVVRSSSSKGLLGFCATYFCRNSSIGHIGAIFVDPARRNLSMGHSLHERAIRALLQKKDTEQFRLGTILPSVYLGIPKTDVSEYKRLKQWFAKLGWNMSRSASVFTMAVQDLALWTTPDGLGQTITNSGIKYDLVLGVDYADVVLDHVQRNSRQDMPEVYQMAMQDREGCGIIRAKRVVDGSMLGSVVFFRSDSKLATFFPGVLNKQALTGGISLPVLSTDAFEQTVLFQGLVLLALRQLKRQGASAAIVDYVSLALVPKKTY